MTPSSDIIGQSGGEGVLASEQVRQIVHDSLAQGHLDGKRVLVIVPDHTRTAPIDTMWRLVHSEIKGRTASLDVMIALGTHHPLTDTQIDKLLGIGDGERETTFAGTRFLNHLWNDPEHLTSVGRLTEADTERLTDGRLKLEVDIPVNRAVLDYDHLLIIGPVFPHEVAGFSGGNKYLFPGIAGREILDFFHWLGALITNPRIIGHKYTPVRAVIDEAASRVPAERSCFALVVAAGGLAGLYYGRTEAAWSAAADLSDSVHITCERRPYHTVLSCAPPMYDDIWVAGKCMYKLEPVVADGGKLIIYAPHVSEVSYSHGEILDIIGYHVRDYFVAQWDRFRDYPWGVLAHSTHVKGIGTYEDGVEKPRVEVILATAISPERCRQINLGYLDPSAIDPTSYAGREEEGVLLVPKAGETLYRLEQDA